MIPQTAVRLKGGSITEPRKSETPVESRGEGQTAPPRQPERKRRFQIVKLEERVAPCNPNGSCNGYGCVNHTLNHGCLK